MDVKEIVNRLTSENGELTLLQNNVNSWTLKNNDFDSIADRIVEINKTITNILNTQIQLHGVNPKELFEQVSDQITAMKLGFVDRVSNHPEALDKSSRRNLNMGTIFIAEGREEIANDWIAKMQEDIDKKIRNVKVSDDMKDLANYYMKKTDELDEQLTILENQNKKGIFERIKSALFKNKEKENPYNGKVINIIGMDEEEKEEDIEEPIKVEEQPEKKEPKKSKGWKKLVVYATAAAIFGGAVGYAMGSKDNDVNNQNAIVTEVDELGPISFAVDEDHNFNINSAKSQENIGFETMKLMLQNGFNVTAKEANEFVTVLNINDMSAETWAIRTQDKQLDSETAFDSYFRVSNSLGSYLTTIGPDYQPQIYKLIANKEDSSRVKALEEAFIARANGDNSKVNAIAEKMVLGENGVNEQTTGAIDMLIITSLIQSGSIDKEFEEELNRNINCEEGEVSFYSNAYAETMRVHRQLVEGAEKMTDEDLENYKDRISPDENMTNQQIEANIENRVKEANITLKAQEKETTKTYSSTQKTYTGSGKTVATTTATKTTVSETKKASEAPAEIKAELDEQAKEMAGKEDISKMDVVEIYAEQNNLTPEVEGDTLILSRDEEGRVDFFVNGEIGEESFGKFDPNIPTDTKETTYKEELEKADKTTEIDGKEVVVVDEDKEYNDDIKVKGDKYVDEDGNKGVIMDSKEEAKEYMEEHKGEIKITIDGKDKWIDEDDLDEYISKMDGDVKTYGGNSRSSDFETEYENDFDEDKDEFIDVTEDKSEETEEEKEEVENNEIDPAKTSINVNGRTVNAYDYLDAATVNGLSISELMEVLESLIQGMETDSEGNKIFEEEIVEEKVEPVTLSAEEETAEVEENIETSAPEEEVVAETVQVVETEVTPEVTVEETTEEKETETTVEQTIETSTETYTVSQTSIERQKEIEEWNAIKDEIIAKMEIEEVLLEDDEPVVEETHQFTK